MNSANPDSIPVITEEQMRAHEKMHGKWLTCGTCQADFGWGALVLLIKDGHEGCPFCLGKWDSDAPDQPVNPNN